MGETADFHWDSKGAGSNERSRRGSCSKLSGKRTIFGRHSGKAKEHPRSNLLRTERRIFQVERQRRRDDRILEWISVIQASLFLQTSLFGYCDGKEHKHGIKNTTV